MQPRRVVGIESSASRVVRAQGELANARGGAEWCPRPVLEVS